MGRGGVCGFSTKSTMRWLSSVSTMPNWLQSASFTGSVATLTWASFLVWKSIIWRTSMR